MIALAEVRRIGRIRRIGTIGRIGLAFCDGVVCEQRIAGSIATRNDLTVVSVTRAGRVLHRKPVQRIRRRAGLVVPPKLKGIKLVNEVFLKAYRRQCTVITC